jgi:UDP-xylose/UDP-N-acetylglucosamine transporter B4
MNNSCPRYNVVQCISVLLVFLGVIMTTSSASRPSYSPSEPYSALETKEYAIGIALLTLALLLSGFLGLIQDWTYAQYKRSHAELKRSEETPPWQESMFYLHLLGLPLFMLVHKDVLVQLHAIHTGPRTILHLPLIFPFPTAPNLPSKFIITIPQLYTPLLLNTLTQLICISGVHRLTASVSSLTVTLVLAVRKAVSLIISAAWFQGSRGNEMMWGGAALVFLGTVGYSIGSGEDRRKSKKE